MDPDRSNVLPLPLPSNRHQRFLPSSPPLQQQQQQQQLLFSTWQSSFPALPIPQRLQLQPSHRRRSGSSHDVLDARGYLETRSSSSRSRSRSKRNRNRNRLERQRSRQTTCCYPKSIKRLLFLLLLPSQHHHHQHHHHQRSSLPTLSKHRERSSPPRR
ncbi:hypothetical protein BDY24DRAFT_182291 [Mrakia frigida]|uniref:uncharacterized protein n=1 Tax=Mrakia frigida TaxID=29902 RepID=UPI003FCBF0F8